MDGGLPMRLSNIGTPLDFLHRIARIAEGSA